MPTLFMVSLGCAKNLVDAETILGETLGDDFALALEPESADVVIINTCGFIQEARDEGREVIAAYLAMKPSFPRLKVVAIGCWAERAPDEIRREFPGLDAVWGLGIPSSLQTMLRQLLAGKTPPARTEPDAGPRSPREGARLLTTPPSFSYLRLSDGCDNRCHYCAIPLIRGGLASRSPEAILEEARLLADQGARELVIISQDTTAYGMDLGLPGVTLPSLLEKLLAAVDVPRLRLLYAHPAHLDDGVIALLRSEPRLCGYLDLPVQHAADSVLARMGRGYGKDRILEIINALGKDVTLRTTILTGFPGETEADFREALELVGAGHFRHLGAFAYSPEPGTPAFSLPDQVSAEAAAERRDAILAAQARHAFAWLDSRVGGDETLLIDSRDDDEWLIARSAGEAPDADGVILLHSTGHNPGDMVLACITGREGYDLVAKQASGYAAKKVRRMRRKK
jgi:ribosomal protein S12 methylthiotransferase